MKRNFAYLLILALVSSLLWPVVARAHQSSTAYLSLQPVDQAANQAANQTKHYALEYRLAVRDLAFLVDIDPNRDHQVTWQELSSQQNAITQRIGQDLQLFAEKQPCNLKADQPLWLDKTAGQTYILQKFKLGCDALPDQLNYHILQGIDAGHRLIISTPTRTWMLTQGSHTLAQASISWLTTVQNYLVEGTHHLLVGADHLLFLFCLLVAAVYAHQPERRQNTALSLPLRLQPVDTVRPALIRTLWIASAFTLAHSITLTLAALQWVTLPAKLVESTIAASIALAAMNNIYPIFGQRQTLIAFGFGLVHGFGFANVLSDLPLKWDERALALLSFNVGIELGQVLCILLFLPVALVMRRTTFYRQVVLLGGSAFAAMIALMWMTQRLLDQNWIPG